MNRARLSPPTAAHLVPVHGGAATPESEIEILSLLRTLWRGKWIILLVTLCTIALAVVYLTRIAVPLYTATSVLGLQNRQQQVVDIESVLTGIGSDQASVNTEVEVLRSRGLIDKLVDRLDLQKDPEFNVFLRPENPWSPEALMALVLRPGEPEPSPAPRVIREKTVEEVLKALTVSNIRQSYVFNITARTRDPGKSSLIADTLADLYIRDQVEVKFAATEHATAWLTDRVAQLKSELDEAENDVQAYKSQMDLISPERLEALSRQLKDFRDRQTGLQAQQEALDLRVQELETARESGDYARMALAARVPALDDLSSRAANGTDAERRAFEKRFEQILERARFEAESNAMKLDTMTDSLATLEQQVTGQSAEAQKLMQLEREAAASRLIYEHFLGRLKELSVQQGIEQADARVLSYATLPVVPSSPRPAVLLPLSAIIGVFAGAALVILLDLRRTPFRTAEEMETETGTAVIGQIPRAPSGRRKRILEHIAEKSNSAMAEAVRNLRTSILLSNVDRTPKVIMMTSSMPGEGKTTLSLAMSTNLAGMGKKVLVIEGDIRRRTFREIFQVKGQRGILSAVLEEVPLEEVLYRDEKLAIDILFGERASINAADFFSSERFSAFLGKVREIYDFIVIDTPPVLMVPDARVIAQLSDVVIYVVHWDSTPRLQVMQGIQAFSTVNAPVTGLVLSQIDPRGMKSYGHSGVYGKGYRSSSKSYYDS